MYEIRCARQGTKMQKEELEQAIHESFESELVVASAKSIYTKGFVNGVRFALKDKGSATDIIQQRPGGSVAEQ